jgi:anti-sigma B factor antagonist
MEQPDVSLTVRRLDPTIACIDIHGEVTGAAEEALMRAYGEASTPTTRHIILNFSGLTYMNSLGIGLLVTLLIRMQRQQQSLAAYGLSEHYRRIFQLTRLDEAIVLAASEGEALAAIRGPA